MLFKFILSFLMTFSSAFVWADLQWSGVYRFEGLMLDKVGLDSGSKSKEYAVHHLVLKPKITVADGFEINARLDAFNGGTDQSVHPTNQIGKDWGGSKNNNDRYYTSSEGNAGAEIIELTQAYLTYTHDFASLVVGRAPINFGLGMTYDSGDGLFDHWYNTRDLVGFKVHIGNFYLFPMYAKIREGSISNSDSEGKEYMFQAEYKNPDKDSKLGFFYSERRSNQAANLYPTLLDPGLGTVYGQDRDQKIRTMNFYYQKDNEHFDYGFEFSYLSGNTGLSLNGSGVDIQAFGVAVELDYAMPKSSIDLGLKFGYASGDDKSTEDKVEGFIFNRNYDVGMLLMNHPLGRLDALGTQTFLRTGYNSSTDNQSRIEDFDVEAISNVMYLAPSLTYHFSENWSLDSKLITAWLVEGPTAALTDIDKSLGYELDIALNFKPSKKIQMTLEGAALLPGSAFDTDQSGAAVDSKFTYGLMGKAAVSF